MNFHLPEKILAGHPDPLGSTVRDGDVKDGGVKDGGVNFAVFSEHASKIEVCIFDGSGVRELRRYALHGPVDSVFHGFLPNVGVGLVYGLRAHGAYAPEQGDRFNANKLLLDPYAKEIVGKFSGRAEHHGYQLGHPDGPRSFDQRDNALYALKARVPGVPESAAPKVDTVVSTRAAIPRVSAKDIVLYEVHVKGFSKLHPDIPPDLRGTYAALAHPAAIAHFKSLGVTTLSLLPVQYAVDEPALVDRGQTNYWGYNTLGFFCPDPRLSGQPDDPTAVIHEFREMVSTLHEHGLEVVLDVVYNHTPEGNEFGPTLSFRGLDNRSYYRLQRDDHSRSENLTGCGNTLHAAHPRVTQFVLDSLRYWVDIMGVDGFRFDLAPILGRADFGFKSDAAFFTALRQDPVLARVHMIAEPWDAGHNGYQVGRFPARFLEWNDKFRDTVRSYWLNLGTSRGEFARRFTASSDLFHHGQRRPTASINFISVHDGFTLHDVVSYSHKYNDANGESNRDGRDGEACRNFGAEGATDDVAVNRLRHRVKRALVATLLLAQGTPMLCGGDEIGNSQQGNNNAYCQDNPTSWLNWPTVSDDDRAFKHFVAEVIALRKSEPSLTHDRWFVPHASCEGERSLVWFTPAGSGMQVHDWHDGGQHAFACQIDAFADDKQSATLMLLFNPDSEPLSFSLAQHGQPERQPHDWYIALDSSGECSRSKILAAASQLVMPAHSLVVLRSATR